LKKNTPNWPSGFFTRLSVWKTAPLERNGSGLGFLALLLAILMLFLLKDAFKTEGPAGPSCRHPAFVQIEGAVRHPGVYPLCVEPTVAALVEAAGGLTGKAVLGSGKDGLLKSGDRIFLRTDGMKVAVSKTEMSAFYKAALGLPISINTESEEGLTALPGIGATSAKAIVEERNKRGGFKNLAEIMKVPGIGRKLYRKIRPYLIL
jgi:competence ComEA-like helix-hairpin-helix protein